MAFKFPTVPPELITDELLTCKLCSCVYSDPRILPCLHSFCKRCLDSQEGKRRGVLACRSCNAEFTLPDFGVDGLQRNLFLAEIVEVAELMKTLSEKGKVSCQACKCPDVDAVTHCIECSQFLCASCKSAHGRFRVTRDHQLINRDEYGSKSTGEKVYGVAQQRTHYCTSHSSHAVDLYCRTCHTLICMRCTTQDHRSPVHDHLPIGKAKELGQRQLRSLMRTLTTEREKIEEASESITEDLQDLNASCKRIESQIYQQTQKLVSHILLMREQMTTVLLTRVIEKRKVLETQIRNLKSKAHVLAGAEEFAESLLKYANPPQYLAIHRLLEERLSKLIDGHIDTNPLENAHVEFIPDDRLLEFGIGEIITSSAIASNTRVEGLKRVVKTHDEITLRVTPKDQHGRVIRADNILCVHVLDCEEKELEKIEMLHGEDGSHEGIICFENEGNFDVRVTLLKKDVRTSPFTVTVVPSGGVMRKVGGEGSEPGKFRFANGIAVNHRDELTVTDYFNNRLQVMHWNGQVRETIKLLGLSEQITPRDVAVQEDGTHVITDGGNKQVLVCDEDGQVSTSFGEKEQVDPNGVAVTKDGHIVVMDQQDRSMKYTVTGATLHPLGVFGKPIFKKALYVAVNSLNETYVSDQGNHQVQVIDERGNLAFSIGSFGDQDGQLTSPTGIDIDEHDNVYVCDLNNDRVVKFTRDGKFICNIFERRLKKPLAIAVSKNEPRRIAITEYRQHHVKILYL
ncbi:tripartite motif-containing protein 2-like [Ptychodera flava]|uniref:tripartite motif-containing protein 2-like n=1 Tax=Ptychodera flava TaxID=63121 RepID=UPI00396A9758